MAAVRTNKLNFEWYEMFGRDKIYPQSRNAIEICKMLGVRHVKEDDIINLVKLGFDVTVNNKG